MADNQNEIVFLSRFAQICGFPSITKGRTYLANILATPVLCVQLFCFYDYLVHGQRFQKLVDLSMAAANIIYLATTAVQKTRSISTADATVRKFRASTLLFASTTLAGLILYYFLCEIVYPGVTASEFLTIFLQPFLSGQHVYILRQYANILRDSFVEFNLQLGRITQRMEDFKMADVVHVVEQHCDSSENVLAFCTSLSTINIAMITLNFVSMVYSSQRALELTAAKEIGGGQVYLMFYMCVWNCWAFGVIVVLTKAWMDLQRECRKTAIILHEFWNKHCAHSALQNGIIKLQLMSLNLFHGKVVFDAWGFFELDYSILFMIVGAGTTYLVILMQFNTMNL